jgi:hypothetical protein
MPYCSKNRPAASIAVQKPTYFKGEVISTKKEKHLTERRGDIKIVLVFIFLMKENRPFTKK